MLNILYIFNSLDSPGWHASLSGFPSNTTILQSNRVGNNVG